MPRLDHAAFETPDPDATAAFYERVFGARIVKAEGHPVMAYVGTSGFAFHKTGGPGDHVGVRVTDEEREELKRRLDAAGVPYDDRDEWAIRGWHQVFVDDPMGNVLEFHQVVEGGG
jgi:catechol 2,3-dioxygenase-like lactoylglutathione lyase family enzyme